MQHFAFSEYTTGFLLNVFHHIVWENLSDEPVFPGVALLESLKERLKETVVDPTILDRLALSRDPDADADANASVSSSDSEVFRRHSKDQPEPSSVNSKRKRMQDG
jgi:hypothetical protein